MPHVDRRRVSGQRSRRCLLANGCRFVDKRYCAGTSRTFTAVDPPLSRRPGCDASSRSTPRVSAGARAAWSARRWRRPIAARVPSPAGLSQWNAANVTAQRSRTKRATPAAEANPVRRPYEPKPGRRLERELPPHRQPHLRRDAACFAHSKACQRPLRGRRPGTKGLRSAQVDRRPTSAGEERAESSKSAPSGSASLLASRAPTPRARDRVRTPVSVGVRLRACPVTTVAPLASVRVWIEMDGRRGVRHRQVTAPSALPGETAPHS